ncbi:hypothetical protein Trydic_g19739 [Trypoxylus dichotomus]
MAEKQTRNTNMRSLIGLLTESRTATTETGGTPNLSKFILFRVTAVVFTQKTWNERIGQGMATYFIELSSIYKERSLLWRKGLARDFEKRNHD